MGTQERFVCIAVDMGASNIRIMAGILDKGQLSYRELHRFDNTIRESDGHERWDMEAILRGINHGVNLAIDEYGNEISSIGVDSWGVDFVFLDKNGKLPEQPVAYRDKRTEGMESLWTTLMSRQETFERSGINFYIFNTLLQLLSMKEKGLSPEASNLLFVPNYIQYTLCGVMKNELTISSTSQMLNVESCTWDEKILELLNIPRDVMGDLCPPGTILGQLNNPALTSSSIKAVAVCAHDTASAVVAVPAVDESYVFISAGTWCLLGMETDQPILTGEALEKGFTNERGYGNTFRFLKNIIGLWLVQGLKSEMPEDSTYSALESLAENAPGGHLVNPDDPSFYNPSSMKQAFDEFFIRTGQPVPGDMGTYFRCAYDSLVYSFRYYIEMLEQMTQKAIDGIHLIGGGSQSEYLCRQTARICSRTVISGPVEAATIGNILVQAIAMDRISGLPEARDVVRKSFEVKTYYANEKQVVNVDQQYARFLRLRDQ